jgi:hypothetical protein
MGISKNLLPPTAGAEDHLSRVLGDGLADHLGFRGEGVSAERG